MDSYYINNQISLNNTCFSRFNYDIAHSGAKQKVSIIIEKNKINVLGIENVDIFLEEIKKIGVIDFTKRMVQDDLYLDLKCNERKLSYLKYTGMIVRCVYEDSKDNFYIIAKHFIDLCKYFPKIDRGLLFTFSCNLYCVDIKTHPNANLYGFNSNHILMLKNGCKIITTKEIKKILNKDQEINSTFTETVDFSKFIVENEKYNKESYLKLIKQNGIK
jgi:hypothetical protein